MKKMIFYSSVITSSTIYLCSAMYMYFYPSIYAADPNIESLIPALNVIVFIILIYSIFKAIIVMNKDE